MKAVSVGGFLWMWIISVLHLINWICIGYRHRIWFPFILKEFIHEHIFVFCRCWSLWLWHCPPSMQPQYITHHPIHTSSIAPTPSPIPTTRRILAWCSPTPLLPTLPPNTTGLVTRVKTPITMDLANLRMTIVPMDLNPQPKDLHCPYSTTGGKDIPSLIC